MIKKHFLIILIFIIFIGSLTLKIWSLKQNYSFDDDEIFTALFIKNSWKDILTLKKYDPGNPPLYFLIAKGWSDIFGSGETKIRSLSLLFDSLSFWLLFIISRKIFRFDLWKIITLMTFFSFSNVMFYYSIYTRTYSFLVFICLLILFFWFQNKKLLNWKFIIASWLALYSHYSSVFFLFFLFLAIFTELAISKKWLELKKIMFNYFLIIFGYLPWILIFIRYQTNKYDLSRKYCFWQLSSKTDYLKIKLIDWFGMITNNIISGYNDWKSVLIVFVLLFLFLFLFLKRKKIKNKNNKNKKIVLYLTIFYLLAFFIGLNNLLVTERYSIFIFPLIWLCLTTQLNFEFNSIKICIIIILTAWISNQTAFYIPVSGHSWKGIGNMANSNKIILEDCFINETFKFYSLIHNPNISCNQRLNKINLQKGEKISVLDNEMNNNFNEKKIENWEKENNLETINKKSFDNGYTVYIIKRN